MTDTLLAVSAERLAAALADHFVMWHDLDGSGPRGEWRCACGKKFGFSDSAIDHQTDALIASGVVTPAASLVDNEALVERINKSQKKGPLVVANILRALAAALEDQ